MADSIEVYLHDKIKKSSLAHLNLKDYSFFVEILFDIDKAGLLYSSSIINSNSISCDVKKTIDKAIVSFIQSKEYNFIYLNKNIIYRLYFNLDYYNYSTEKKYLPKNELTSTINIDDINSIMKIEKDTNNIILPIYYKYSRYWIINGGRAL